MQTESSGKRKTRYGAKIIAIVLVAGGLLGILTSVPIGLRFAQQGEALKVVAEVLSVTLFGWGIVTGVAVWREMPRGFRWAKILFALQVPTFGIAHLTYEFSTLFSFRVMAGNTSHTIGANIGSSSNLFWSSQPLGVMFGVNIVAVLALLYLIRNSIRRGHGLHLGQGEIEG